MNKDFLPDEHPTEAFIESNESRRNIHNAQETIYHFFLKMVVQKSPEEVLLEFKYVFIDPVNIYKSEATQALYSIIFSKQEDEYRKTLKRTCYILLNNWCVSRQHKHIHQLIQLFGDSPRKSYTLSLPLRRIRHWLENFINSKDYQEIKLFSSVYQTEEKSDWSHRYTSYLLAPQYLNTTNSQEQREAARELSRQLKQQFKFELAMYTAHSQSAVGKAMVLKNPTRLGDEALRLIKKIVARRGLFSYANLANIFTNQNQKVSYKIFKESLHRYLIYSLGLENETLLTNISQTLGKKIQSVYQNYHTETLNNDLILRTCNQVIDYLTTEDQRQPSSLFIALISHGETLALAMLLIKILLICPNVRAHLEFCIANLIQYYEKYPESECVVVINFLEVFNIVLNIYAEDVRYNLVNIKGDATEAQVFADLDAYRVFSQLKGELNLEGANLIGTDLQGTDLSSVNLYGAQLNNVNLSNANLSNANLSSANLSNANLSEADLMAANLNNAMLNGTNLHGAKLRRANLSSANLIDANLIKAKLFFGNLARAGLNGAKLSGANLNSANLNSANLGGADLSDANLSGADLRSANLSSANLSGTNLSNADLSGANLSNARLIDAVLHSTNLRNADLRNTNLSGADLSGADLSGAKLKNARFKDNLGLSQETKLNLKRVGAIFEDSVQEDGDADALMISQ